LSDRFTFHNDGRRGWDMGDRMGWKWQREDIARMDNGQLAQRFPNQRSHSGYLSGRKNSVAPVELSMSTLAHLYVEATMASGPQKPCIGSDKGVFQNKTYHPLCPRLSPRGSQRRMQRFL
ncbi:hypothetical protein KCU88_g445, partial [Aureobasidium melanogenum]